ncbi:MAG: hypothetical protein LQ341_005392 [Variospora aurantia]|nr:MAG: hypothetical protein LQ341_005392 [Variospora aurantia]
MPRAGKKAANQHNTRHENGVVAPGKRITKQKSNGHINGLPNGSVHPNLPPSASPAAASPVTPLPDNVTDGHQYASKYDRNRAGSAGTFQHDPQGDLSEDLESMENGTSPANGVLEHNHRRIDVNAAKGPAVADHNIFSLALTILRSCPLADTIAILIFLLSLPPTLLSVTNALFAVLTFMPPAGSFSSIPMTLTDVFQGSGGTPSLATILVTDALGIVLWLVAWSPLQALGLELAQAVVATTLGGGDSGKRSSSDSTLFCMLIVFLTHVARHKWIPKRIFGYEWSVRLASIAHLSENFPAITGEENQQPRSVSGWFRILIALHILIQGLVHVARRWYTKREYSQTVSSGKKPDPEAGAGAQSQNETGQTAFAGSSDLPSKASLLISKEARDKISNGKKRRKQGTYVRRQQPLWAAFAATKVTVLREMEQSQALSEALGSNATDTKNLGSAPFVTEEGRVWITLVQPNNFFFDTSYFSGRRDVENSCSTSEPSVSAGIDRSKPLFVRINGADWISCRIERLSAGASKDECANQRWTGEVYGLSPSSSYNCSFVRSEDGVVIHSAVVSTPSPPAPERETSDLSSPPPPTVRPSSPTTPSTTLKKSIAAYEISLNESQAQLKRNKKDHKQATSALRRDIEKLNASIAKQTDLEKSQTNRQLQLSQHSKQADEVLASLTDEIEEVSNIPDEEMEEWKAKKSAWEEEQKRLDAAKEDYQSCKAAAHQEKQAVVAEASSTQQKHDRLQGRKAKLSEQYERLQSANSQDLDEKGRKEAEHAARLAGRRQIEERSNEQIAMVSRAIQDTQYHTQQILQQTEALAKAFHVQHNMALVTDVDHGLVEGDAAGVAAQGLPSSGQGFRFPQFASPDTVGMQNGLGALRQDTRPRSSSLLAGSTPYADFFDQDPAPPMPTSQAMRFFRGRQPSGSSGSGSNGSQLDASPVSVLGSRKSPVGKKGSPVWN